MAAAGLGYPAARPSLARLDHLRAVLAARLWFTASPAWSEHRGWWQSERRIRRKGPAAGTHRPDAEIWWPSIDGSPYAGQVWAIEVELTAKHAARTAAIMEDLTAPAGYAQVLYLTAPAARGVVDRCAGALPAGAPVTVWDLPADRIHPGYVKRETREMDGNNHGETVGNSRDKAGGRLGNARVISYNLSEAERPGGIKVRYKIRIVTGKRAKEIDARQARVIMEVLQWSRQHQHP